MNKTYCKECAYKLKIKEKNKIIDVKEIAKSLNSKEIKKDILCHNCNLSGITIDENKEIWLISGKEGEWKKYSNYYNN